MSWTAHILTIFPSIFGGFIESSLIGKAAQRGLVQLNLVDIREFATGRHKSTDDAPYGGGAGMVMSIPPIVSAIESLGEVKTRILLSPQGKTLDQGLLEVIARSETVALICGRYEGVDERVQEYIDLEVSIGDYVLNGGEVAAMVVLDGVIRLVPGVIGNPESTVQESHHEFLLEYPQYTRPVEFRGLEVPEILLSGNHGEIEKWRRRQSLLRTRSKRPDLWDRYTPSQRDIEIMEKDE